MSELDVIVRYVSNQINATPPCADGVVRVSVETVCRWITEVTGQDLTPRRVVAIIGAYCGTMAWEMRRRPR